MFRIGRMIRSAKMKLITPPKLMPPFQSTAARGTLPTEHTKLIIEMNGPTNGLPELRKDRVARQKEGLPERCRHPRRKRPRDEQAHPDIGVEAVEIHVQVV